MESNSGSVSGGGTLTSSSVRRRAKIALDWSQKAAIVKEIDAGAKVYDVALRINVKQETVRNWIREYRHTCGVGYVVFGCDFYYALISGPAAAERFFGWYGITIDSILEEVKKKTTEVNEP